jgi:hypothetical protein
MSGTSSQAKQLRMNPMKEMGGALGHQYLSSFLYPFILGSIEVVSPRTKITFSSSSKCHLRQTRDDSSSASRLMQISANNLGA